VVAPLGVALLGLSPGYAHTVCSGKQHWWLPGEEVFLAPQLVLLSEARTATVGVVDSLLWWYQPSTDRRGLHIYWFSLPSRTLLRRELLPFPRVQVSPSVVRRILIGISPQELFPSSPPERQRQWEKWRREILQWSDSAIRRAWTKERWTTDPGGIGRCAVDVTASRAAAVLRRVVEFLAIWKRVAGRWHLDTVLPWEGVVDGIRFLDSATLAVWGTAKVGRYVPYTSLALLSRTLQGWRVQRQTLRNPEGLIFTVFLPRQLMDVSRRWVVIAEPIRYRLRLYPLRSVEDSVVLERMPAEWRAVGDTAYVLLDRDPYRADLKDLMDLVRGQVYSASSIQSVMFLDDTTLSVRWYTRQPLPHDSGTLLERTSRQGFLTAMDIWQYRLGRWELLDSNLCPPNPSLHHHFVPLLHPLGLESYCDGRGNCFTPIQLAPGVRPQDYTYGELKRLLEHHARENDSVLIGMVWHRWQGKAEVHGGTGRRQDAVGEKISIHYPENDRQNDRRWRAVTLAGDTLDVATLARVVAVVFLSGSVCLECIPEVVQFLRSRTAQDRKVRWVALCLAGPGAVERRSYIQSVREYLGTSLRWVVAFDLCEGGSLARHDLPERLPCRWWGKLRIHRTPAAALFRNGQLVHFWRFEDLGLTSWARGGGGKRR
jgi:hypothetical protein